MSKYLTINDPEEERWRKKYPNFPGVHKCAELLRSPNVKGTWIDIICLELQDHAADNFAKLVQAIQSETDERVKILLVAALAEAGLPEAVPILTESLHSSLGRLAYWAEFGLEKPGQRRLGLHSGLIGRQHLETHSDKKETALTQKHHDIWCKIQLIFSIAAAACRNTSINHDCADFAWPLCKGPADAIIIARCQN